MPTPTSNNYYDNIDKKILRTEYEGTIIFEDDSSISQASPPPCRDHQHKDRQFPVISKINKKIHTTDTNNTKTITKIPSHMTITAKDLNLFTADELAQLIRTVAKLLNEDTVEYVTGMLSKDPYDNDTKEFVCEI